MSTENEKLQKIKKASGVTAKVLKVFEWILIVSAAITALVIVYMMFNKDAIRESFAQQLTVKGADGLVIDRELSFNTRVVIGSFSMDNPLVKVFDFTDYFVIAVSDAILAILMLAFAFFVIYEIRSIFVYLKENDTPFVPGILKKIKVIGIIVSILALFESLGSGAIAALVFWCVYAIFDYGIILQKNQDETL